MFGTVSGLSMQDQMETVLILVEMQTACTFLMELTQDPVVFPGDGVRHLRLARPSLASSAN
jgi:hypothetical protein